MKKLMSKKLTKTLVLAACAILLVVGTVMGTVAYLTDKAEVTNTFTYGKVDIELIDNTDEYKLVPGEEYRKDTTITVKKGSEECYLFVKVPTVNGFAYTFATENDEGWTKINENNVAPGTDVTDVYCYSATVKATAEDAKVKVLTLLTYANNAANPTDSTETTVTVIGYAVQATGFDNAAEAWEATFGKPATPQS